MIAYDDLFIRRLHERIAALIEGDESAAAIVRQELEDLTRSNIPAIARYRAKAGEGVGVPDTAFRGEAPFHFAERFVAKSFRTSGTSGTARGIASYSELGLDLMRRSIVANGRRHVFDGLSRPCVVRLVPEPALVPDGIMPYGMALLSETFGDPATSRSLIGKSGLEFEALTSTLDRAVAEERAVVLIGGSFAFVNLCDALQAKNRRWKLPAGSRMVDAGGFKGRSRELDVDALRRAVADVFGVSPARCTNIFGMTELASQLYDGADVPVGPKGERPKAECRFVHARVRDPFSWKVVPTGAGLVEVADLCILDRPHVVLTGDWGVASDRGVAITGRMSSAESRGCALSFESPSALLPGGAP